MKDQKVSELTIALVSLASGGLIGFVLGWAANAALHAQWV